MPTGSGGTPALLQTLDANGTAQSQNILPAAQDRALWDRLLIDDGSFLLETFSEDPTTAADTARLQHLRVDGSEVSSEVVTPAGVAPVLLSMAQGGAVEGWYAAGAGAQWVDVAPIDVTGATTGPTVALEKAQANYGASLAPVPDGDVLATQLHLDGDDWTLTVHALLRDGRPRGPSTAALHVEAGPATAVVSPEGARTARLRGLGHPRARAHVQAVALDHPEGAGLTAMREVIEPSARTGKTRARTKRPDAGPSFQMRCFIAARLAASVRDGRA